MSNRPWYRTEGFKIAVVGGAIAAVLAALVIGVASFVLGKGSGGANPPVSGLQTPEAPTTTALVPTPPTTASAVTSTAQTGVSPPVRYLAEEEPVENEILGAKARGGTADVAGKTYAKSILVDYGTRFYPAAASWNLSKRGGTFRALIGLSDDSGTQARARFEAVGDGRLLAEATIGLGETVPVNVSVDGVLRLTLRISGATKADQYLTGVWGNARVVAPGAADDPQP